MTCDQLVLTDETLRVLYTLLPYGRPAVQVGLARNSYDGGHLTVREVRLLADFLSEAAADPRCLVTREALAAATAQFHDRLRDLDLDEIERGRPGEVSIFVWDESRDGPIGETVLAYAAAAASGRQAVAAAAARPAARPENRQPPRNVPSKAR